MNIMKLIKRFLAVAAAIVVIIPLMTSCDNGDDGVDYMSLITVKINSSDKTVWGLTDNNSKIYLNPQSGVSFSQIATEGQRAIIYYNSVNSKVDGFDVNADVKGIEKIVTKDICKLTAENEESLGNYAINVADAWIGGGYLNLSIRFYGSGNVKHTISLAENTVNPEKPEKGKVFLELRHNSNGDLMDPARVLGGYICFKLGDYDPSLIGSDAKICLIFKDTEGITRRLIVSQTSTSASVKTSISAGNGMN